MEILISLAVLACLVLLVVNLSKQERCESTLADLRVDLSELVQGLASLRREIRTHREPLPEDASQTEPLPRSLPQPAADEVPAPVAEFAPLVAPEAVETPAENPEVLSPSREAVAPPPLPERRPVPGVGNRSVPAADAKPEPKPEPSRFEASVREILGRIWNWIVVGEEHRPKGVTMEFAVATTWLIRTGVLILVIGIGFFLKYSIAKGYLGPTARVLLAATAGAGLVAGGLNLFGGRYRVLGQGLAGAGFATLYFSFFTAHQPGYELFGPVAAFALMALVTAVAGAVAVRYDSLLVALLGLLGGYGTPLMIRTGSDSVALLFGYVLLLGLGMFLVASRREWRLLHYLSFASTCFLVALTIARSFAPDRFWEFMPFLLAFFALFSSVTFVYQLVHRQTATLLEIVFLFLNAAAFTGFSVGCIDAAYPREAVAFLTLGLAAFYILHVAVFLKRGLRDRGLLLSFMGLAAFFVAITLPIVFSEGWITVSWALQAFAMLWIASRMRSEFLRQLAYLLYLVVLARLALFDFRGQFAGLSGDQPWPDYAAGLVERLLLFGIPIGSFFAGGRLFRHEAADGADWPLGEGNDVPPLPGQTDFGRACFWIFVGLAFAYLNLEVWHTMDRLFDPLMRPGLTLVWVGFGALLLREMLANRSRLAAALLGILAAALVAKVFLLDFLFWKPGIDLAFAPSPLSQGFLMRTLDYGAAILLLVFAGRVLSGRADHAAAARVFGYAGLAAAFVYSSLEAWTALTIHLPGFRMGGISLFWSHFAFALLLAGMIKGRAALRGIGLVLLGATILKVFLLDLAGLDQLHRIVAFLVLGIVVLAGSYLYFRFSQRFETRPSQGEDKPSPSEP